MAGSNIQGDLSGHILPEFDYDNIILIDPNKTIDNTGRISERIVDHENLVMYANLEAQILPRTKLALGVQPNENVNTSMTIARINFLKPTKNNYIGTGYYDELTGKDALTTQFSNAKLEKTVTRGNKAYFVDTVLDQQNVTDNGLLGITSIICKLGTSFIPSVSMQLEDVQGKALFQLGDNSPYAAFFTLPYPQFYLTLKGYYGQAIKYQLYLEKFDARFNTSTGNYAITLEFKGFKFNILNEILISHLLATPHMYNRRFATSLEPVVANPATNNQSLQNSSSAQQGGITTATRAENTVYAEFVTERGYEKIVEVYSEYKSKGLIPQDFPELTLLQLMNKLEMFERNVVNSYPLVNVEPLTNIRNYLKTLKAFVETLIGPQSSSWFLTNLDPRAIILDNNNRVYFFKKELQTNLASQTAAIKNLSTIFDRNLSELRKNPTLGVDSTENIKIDKLTPNQIQVTIDLSQINKDATAASFFNVISASDVQKTTTKNNLDILLAKKGTVINGTTVQSDPIFFNFDQQGGFTQTVNQIEEEVLKKLKAYETAITEELKILIQDKSTGIGFNPTVRNMCAVIMANTEGFIRLLDDCHTKAWSVKYDPVRSLAIHNNKSSARNTEAQTVVQITSQAAGENQGIVNGQTPVYPWPQFFVESPDDKKGRYQLQYLGAPSVVKITQASDFSKWPEVEFVEEYIKGLIMKDNVPSTQTPIESQLTTFAIQINAIEYPTSNVIYSNKQEVRYFYEIWEREYVTANYSNFSRALPNQVTPFITLNTSVETNNIIESLGVNSPSITFKLKNTNLNSQNYPTFLKQISNNGTGPSYYNYERGFFVTSYLKELTDNPFSILKTTELGLEPLQSADLKPLVDLTKNASNDFKIIDTYPFTSSGWVQTNMSQSSRATLNNVFDTKNVITVFADRNMVSNFTDLYDYINKRPVTNFGYRTTPTPSIVVESLSTQPNVSTQTMNLYYNGSLNNTTRMVPTEGFVQTPSSNYLGKTQTTSILNTPFFINAIQNGVRLEKNRNRNPYIQAAYLFINSLPLISLRERYKSLGINNELDYMASCFNKFGAVHKVPYAWILKMGSIWYRYKTYVETNRDILDGIWNNFDYLGNFDPVFSAKTTTYEFQFPITNPTKYKVSLEKQNQNLLEIQTGFYPKLMNDFAYFYNGRDLFQNYSNDEIQSAVSDGLRLYQFPNSEFSAEQNNKDVNVSTWSALLPNTLVDAYSTINLCVPATDEVEFGTEYYILPSFGANMNQTNYELVTNQTSNPVTTTDLVDNKAMYNGSVRCLWAASNYGYFDANQVIKPDTDSYMNLIYSDGSTIVPFQLLSSNTYSTMEEIFGVSDKRALDLMEKEFLNYCAPITNVKYAPVRSEINKSAVQIDGISRNFQAFMREAMKLTPTLATRTSELFKEAITNQFNNFSSQIKSIMEYDVIIRNGNPSKFNRKVWESYISIGLPTPTVVEPITFQPYVTNTLPSVGGGITLQQSQNLNGPAWRALLTEVGFSSISELTYTDNGSYITDFFINNNIEFSSRNVVLLAPIIKMYATQRLNNPNLLVTNFRDNLTAYINNNETFQNDLLNQVIISTQAKLPDVQEPQEQTIQSGLSGLQGKVEIYNVFKALNDKWVAGYDYSQRTLFEDILFLDRASRNIGETVVLDIFSIKNLINKNSLNEGMSVYTLLSSMLMQNNFVVMPLPAYCNFYNVQEVNGLQSPNTESTLEFADNMWGTFTNVDYRKSGPKIVCFYVGKPSDQLGVSVKLTGIGDDGFDLRNPTGNPLIENQLGKNDFDKSNKVVGFNVDIGIRNQNVFQTFSVSQDNGKATSESIAAVLMMADQTNTKNVGTQNASLYNFYKRRSYQCEVSAMGNALIQPTMYFNLRHVPMFNGPYLITDVSHTITPGDFTTNFTGVRQGIYDYPVEDNYLQKINQNLLTQLENLVIQKTDQNTTITTTNQGKETNLIQNSNNLSVDAQNACRANLSPQFDRLESTTGQLTKLTATDFSNSLKTYTGTAPNAELQTIVYVLSYIRTFSIAGDPKGEFVAYDNNFSNITLDKPIASSLTQDFVPNVYACIKTKTISGDKSLPAAKFNDVNTYLKFMTGLITPRISQITGGVFKEKIIEYYCTAFPAAQVTLEYYESNIDRFLGIYGSIVDQAIASAGRVGLRTDIGTAFNQGGGGQQTTIPACPPTVLSGFSPLTGTTGTVMSLSGTNLEYVRTITVGTTQVDFRTVQFISTNKIKFSIPQIVSTPPQQLQISVTTTGNAVPVTAPGVFTFI